MVLYLLRSLKGVHCSCLVRTFPRDALWLLGYLRLLALGVRCQLLHLDLRWLSLDGAR